MKDLIGFNVDWTPPKEGHGCGVLTVNRDSRFVSRWEMIRAGLWFIKKGMFK